MVQSNFRRFARAFIRSLRRPPREALTTVHVLTVMVVVELLIRWVALPRLTRLLGVRVDLDPAPADVKQMPVDDLPVQARQQLRCTERVADAWPFSRGPCLRRSLVGGHLLRDLNPAVRIGLAGSGDAVLAHAWLEINDRPLEPVTDFNRFQRPLTEVQA
jgi:Transglutaminase-like superfamily